ncbi:uncharacterized protein LOC104878355 isoform X2 [Vitis vinifera]|uniref:uncharacterized protein LOC104878355 isoform X2 n=1 Tax=Vitis vinifera TaxID=29760 RepID=UPI002883126D|nr:uncharacterized protein LOC104878355 isoform X2 [Vitis vinifera]
MSCLPLTLHFLSRSFRNLWNLLKSSSRVWLVLCDHEDFMLGRCWIYCQWRFGSLVQAVTCNCLTTRESTLVSIHARNMTVYRRALSRCHTIFSSRLSYIFTLFVSVGPQGIQTSRI